MSRKKIIASLAIVVFIFGGVYFWTTLTEHRSDVVLSGNVDIREVNLSFRVAGRLKQLAVDEGAQVHGGDVLGELDPEPYRIALNDLTASHAALLAHRDLYHAGYRREDIAQAQATVKARLAAQGDAIQNYRRQQLLANTGASTERNLDDARAQRDQAIAQTEVANQQLQELQHGYRKEEIAEVNANEEHAAAQMAQAQLQLGDTKLIAPSAGTIVTRAVEPGTMLAAGSTVLTLSLDYPVWIRAYVSEEDLGKVALGKKVKVYSDSRKAPYDAIIGFVSPTAEFTPKNVETQDLRTALVYRLRVIVNNPDGALRQGMPVTVTLAVNH